MDDVLRHRTDFAKVRPVPVFFVCRNDQAFLFHQTLHDFLRQAYLASAQCCTQSPVSVAAVIALKDVGHRNTCIGVFVWPSHLAAVIEIGTAGQAKFDQQL